MQPSSAHRCRWVAHGDPDTALLRWHEDRLADDRPDFAEQRVLDYLILLALRELSQHPDCG